MQNPFSPHLLTRLQQLKIRTRRAFLGSRQGTHISLRRGHGLEFSEFRPYAAGDDYRYIDWGVYGRSDRLYIRQFREEQDLQVSLLLDCSASMGLPENSKKFELAQNIALALGFIALTDGDSAVFSFLGQKNSPRFRGAKSFAKILREFDGVQPEGSFDLCNEIRAAVARHKTPGKCFLISDFLSDLDTVVRALDHLRARNFEIVLLHILSPEELDLNLASERLVDSESGEELEIVFDTAAKKTYARELGEHLRALERYAAQSAMQYVLIPSSEPLSEVMFRYLARTGILK